MVTGLFIFAAIPLPLASASAQDGGGFFKKQDWSVSIGALAVVKPKYEGSKRYEITALPSFDIRWRDRVYLNRDGLGVNVIKAGGFRLGVIVGYRFGRDEDDSVELAGLGDVDGGLTIGAIAQYRFSAVLLSAKIAQQVTGDDGGFLATLSGGVNLPVGKRLFVRPIASVSFASGDYMSSYFGVSPAQSARSGLRQYNAEGGIKDVSFGLNLTYLISRRWRFQALGRYSKLLGDAGDSPVVRSTDQFFVGFGFTFRFGGDHRRPR